MKKRISFFLLSGLVLFNFSCYYDQEIDLSEPLPDIPVDQIISFQADIEPLFVNCTGCHNGTVASPDLRAGNAYNEIIGSIVAGDAEASDFYQKLPGNNHPGGNSVTLSGEDLALIKAWIDRGADNN